jgi:hypothetical protein
VVRGNESRVFDSRTREIASCKKGDYGYEYLTVGSSWTETRSPKISEDRRIVADFKDDNYVVGPGNKETEFLEFGN